MGHADLDGVIYISCTNMEVNKLNDAGLNKLKTDLITSEAVNFHSTIKNFKPNVNKKGNIGTEKNETPFRQTLHMKVGAKVMLTFNVDVLDGLTNGSRGEIVGFEMKKSEYIEKVIIKFDDEWQGRQKRECDKINQKKYPGCTAIEKVMYQYPLGRKNSSISNSARVIQFPLRLCFATTAHKFQGQTVTKPNKIAIDLRSVFKPAMAYVMLSRVQEISQLFIIGSVPAKKIYADQQALDELKRLDKISLNKNESKWESNKSPGINIFSLNCQSLRPKIKHIKDDPVVQKSDVICLTETWLMGEDKCVGLEIDDFVLYSNSVGHGKGTATYFRKHQFHHCVDVIEEQFQLTKISSENVAIISVYRSSQGDLEKLTTHLLNLIVPDKVNVICGDVNICFKSDRSNILIKSLEENGFKQFVKEATHIKGGLIDHAYIRSGLDSVEIDVSIYSPYYCAKDHDAVLISLDFEW